jgi:uncharacterized protein
MPVRFAVSIAELHLPGARSLKEKRSVVRRLVDRIHRRCRASVAEIGYQDKLQRAEIGIALVHGDARELERLLSSIEEILANEPEATLLSWEPETLDTEP